MKTTRKWICALKVLFFNLPLRLKASYKVCMTTLRFIAALFVLVSSTVQAADMKLVTSHWPPNNYLDENGKPTGLSVTVVNEIRARLGINEPIVLVPFARGYRLVSTTPNVFLFAAGKTEDRINMGHQFIGPITTSTHMVVARKGSQFSFKSLDDIRENNISVACVRGSWQAKLLKSAGINVEETDTLKTGARMLMAGRVDAWVIFTLQAGLILGDLGYPVDATEPVHVIRGVEGHIMVSKGTDPALVKKWEQAFEELKHSNFIKEAAKDWSRKLGTEIIFDQNKGFVSVDTRLMDDST